MQLRLKSEFIPLVQNGIKRSTIRAGRWEAALGPAEIVCGSTRIPIKIISLDVKTLSTLTDIDAVNDGFSSKEELRKTLLKFYPQLKANDEVTIIHFIKSVTKETHSNIRSN